MRTISIAIAAVAISLVSLGGASAEMSRNVIATFKGQLVITKHELSEGKTEKDTIAKIKSERLSEVVGETTDDVTYWNFHYTAFLKQTGASSLKMEFYRDGKQYSADKRLDGIDPKSAVLTGDIAINEDEGLVKGKTYVIKLTTEKDVVVAQATLVMK